MRPAMLDPAIVEEANHYRRVARRHIVKEKWENAIAAYTRVIRLLPGQRRTKTYLYRAECYYKMKQWVLAKSDCKKVLKRDPSNVKARSLLGFSLREVGEFPESLSELQKALDMAVMQKVDFSNVESIRIELNPTKYLQWEHLTTTRLMELEDLKKSCQAGIKQQHKYNMRKTKKVCAKQLELLDHVFHITFEAEKVKEVPHVLCCPLSAKIFHDPVTTPQGETFDHFALIEHFSNVISYIINSFNCII